MKKSNEKLQSLIKKRKLNEPEVLFGDYGTFEEIPIFSKWAHINFLKEYGSEERNKILLKVSNDLVERAISDAKVFPGVNFDEYFICVSITDWDDIKEFGCFSPNIFISRRKAWILPLLSLREHESTEANMLKAYFCDLDINGKIICVSKSYGGDNDRIFIVDNFFLN